MPLRLSLATILALALSAGVAGATEFPSFNCGGGGAAIIWASATASQPNFYDPASGASGDIGCSGADFVQVIPRKAGGAQQEYLPPTLTVQEAFAVNGAPITPALTFDVNVLHQQIVLPNAVSAYETYFDITQFAAFSEGQKAFADLFLGLKITTLDPFQGDIALQWNPDRRFLKVLIPGQEQDAMLQLTSVPSAAPEPATWAMLVAGLMGAGMLLRRRRARGRASHQALTAP